ncbi:MAG: aminotransferase class IV [Bacteriovoracaceae bacterium]
MIVSINGIVVPLENAKISVFDRGFLYGDSIYESLITIEGKIFRFDKHLGRLKRSANLMGMEISYTDEEIENFIKETINQSQTKNLRVRLVVTRGTSEEPNLDPTLSTENNIVVMAYERKLNPSWWYEKGVEVIIADVQRVSPKSVDPNIKSGNYLNNVLAYKQAKEKNAFEAIMLNQSGFVTEATTSNVWMVKDNIICTPPIHEGLLGGLTRETILELAKAKGLSIEEKPIRPQELLSADECFLTSTARFVVPIIKVDEITIGNGEPGPISKRLLELLKEEAFSYSN